MNTYTQPTPLSQMFVRARAIRGWSMDTMRKHLGVSISTLCQYERAEIKPLAKNLATLAEKLGVSLGEMADAYALSRTMAPVSPMPSFKRKRLPGVLVPARNRNTAQLGRTIDLTA